MGPQHNAINPQVDTPAEHAYLSMLAGKLELPDALVGAIHEVAAGDDMPPPGAQQAPSGIRA